MKTGTRNMLIAGAVALQFLVLAYMAGEREWIVRTGRVVYFRTAPVDPRDPFRGDYVTLDYEIGHVSTNRLRDGLVNRDVKNPLKEGERVYAALRLDGDLASVEYLTDRKPETSPFVRGRIANRWSQTTAQVRYGIEAYFVEQGKGRDLERRGGRDEVQVPLEMETALGRNGAAVLRGYRWSRLGVGLETETVTSNRTDGTRSAAVTIVTAATLVLMNASDTDLAVIDPPGMASVTLEQDTLRTSGDSPWKWVGENRTVAGPVPADADVHILKPGEKYRIRVDLGDEAWFVEQPGQTPRTMSGITDWNARFRIVYRPPATAACGNLKNADLVWHGFLMSRAFDGGGRVD